jgi:cell division transport system ATP-binding protein
MDLRGVKVEIQGVRVAYTDLVVGLRGVDITIEPGEFVFLCGSTGSGKSTLLRVLTRETLFQQGEALIDGRKLSQVTPDQVPILRRSMGIVPQNYALLPRRKVWENVAYAMRSIGHSREDVRRRVPEILEEVNILHRADAFPHELSGGEQQRVAIARALIHKPPLILADEPTGNLDPRHSREILQVFERLHQNGATIIVATHDMDLVRSTQHRVVRLDDGCVVEATRIGGR